MSGEQKSSIIHTVVTGAFAIITSLISILYMQLKERVDKLEGDVINLRLNDQHTNDGLLHHGDFINNHERRLDYLDKIKQNKKKQQSED